jgi:radical SAM superfamily enzyme YgiQ (UPF0313 family)
MLFINPDSRANRDIPNIGLALAATFYNTKVIDLNTLPDPKDRFLHNKTDILGISVQSRTYNEALRIKELYKDKYPNAVIKSVSGFLDVQCCYPYISFDDDMNTDIPFGDEMPFPDYDLLDSIAIFSHNWQSGKWRYAIITSLGCPFSCTYCSASKRKIETRSIGHCVEELGRAKEKWGVTKFTILDDCFNARKERVLEFCEMVEPLKLRWGCANGLRADRFDEDTAKALYSTGCDFISFGVESSNNDVLKIIKKGETIEQIEKAVEIAKKYFRMVNGYFIIGLPGSSYEKDLASLKWSLRNNINAHFSYYVPFDKQIYYDTVFYGNDAEPVFDEYPSILQKEIFELTACMRADYKKSALKRIFRKLLLKLRFAPTSVPEFLRSELRSHIHA